MISQLEAPMLEALGIEAFRAQLVCISRPGDGTFYLRFGGTINNTFLPEAVGNALLRELKGTTIRFKVVNGKRCSFYTANAPSSLPFEPWQVLVRQESVGLTYGPTGKSAPAFVNWRIDVPVMYEGNHGIVTLALNGVTLPPSGTLYQLRRPAPEFTNIWTYASIAAYLGIPVVFEDAPAVNIPLQIG